MRKLIVLLTLLLISIASLAQAAVTTVTGSGASAAAAEEDALRMAVENAVGTLVDSKTVVANSQVLEDRIYTASRGFIRNYEILDKGEQDGIWHVTIRADVATEPDSHLMNALTRERIIKVNMRNAKIAVVLDAQDIVSGGQVAEAAASAAGETAVINKFLEAGFSNIIDISGERERYNRPYDMTDGELEGFSGLMQADILIVGRAASENIGDVGKFLGSEDSGIFSSRARIEAKMYVARTGKIIAATSVYGAGADISKAVASQKALGQAGEKLGRYMVEQVLNLFSGTKQGLELTVIAESLDGISRLKKTLAMTPGVKNVSFNNYSDGRGMLSVEYTGAPQELFRYLKDNFEQELELESASFSGMVLIIR